ncbi:hypothetical protein M23134_02546 [Microscilla marina ATCC 23134]|uniref:Transposase IS4-like domain-containing protein n=3 Tax=Microscilla TaxID=1023 RepID=A1ZTW2_MICM2|nr:hypothetical protein M23134_02989 [Microscilla marina ATCC 23134]EAY25396.1 hypothetical protein M23134_06655 [Microscilla marina ATCC 23134]EAY26214.1 hypothetical protein M23134_02546 [Microscilla marina ATCC 23134]
MLDGSLKTVLDSEKLNISLLANNSEYFKDKDYVVVLHDPSDIRKKYSQEADHLCKVLDLDKKLINGYRSLSSACVDIRGKNLRLLRCSPYSTTDANYLKVEELRLYEDNKLKDQNRAKEIKLALTSGQGYNLKSLVKDHTSQITGQIRASNPNAVIVDVYDRGFDDTEVFEHETDLGNLFVVRSKLNRVSNELQVCSSGKEKNIKLRHQQFFQGDEVHYQKMTLQGKTYQDAKGVFEWNEVEIKGRIYSVVKIRFFDRAGRNIFKNPMLLITNMQVDQLQMAQMVFELYCKRAKIEGVFKFCKEVLGWEDNRIPDYNVVKNLISLIYFVAGYFYEIEDQLTQDKTIEWIAQLGGGKGKITRHFILNGFAQLINYKLAQRFFEQQDISPEQVNDALNRFSFGNE